MNRRFVTLGLGAIVAAVLAFTRGPAQAGPPRLDPQLFLMAPGCFLNGYDVLCLQNPHLNFYRDFAARHPDGSINQVVEIPAGTNAKFEVSEETGVMSWELKNGVPRVVSYSGYVGNYGMIPRTMGGDGDSLDVVTLGRLEARGSVVKAKVIGVLKLVDSGDRDDKLIAVLPDTVLGNVNALSELNAQFPGITNIIETWFANYKGPGEMVSNGFGEVEEATRILDDAINAYRP